MGNKKGFEMSFATIFALIAGAAILFLAIYFAYRFIGTQQTKIDAQTAAKLAVLMDPLETSMGESKSNILHFVTETRIYNDRCSIDGNFGNQQIGIASSGFGNKWKTPTYGKKQHNKYVFSDEIEESKEFYVFVKSFNLPFKVSDIFILMSENYCFASTPEAISWELESLNPGNFEFTDSGNCSKGSKKVCFSGSSGCDISVYGEYGYKQGYVSKDGEKLEYIGPLLYAAIFSSPEVYSCNAKRLKMRAARLALIYQDEIKILEKAGCSSQLDAPLTGLVALANSDSGLVALQDAAEDIEIVNSAAECRIF